MSGGAQMRNQGDNVHPRVMRVGRALCLIELFNDFLTGHVAYAAAASRLLPRRFFTIEIDTSGKSHGGRTKPVLWASSMLAIVSRS